MARNVVEVQCLVAELLTDVQSRRAWERDPRGFATRRLSGSAEIDMIAGLSRAGIAAAALHLDLKRVTSHGRILAHESPRSKIQEVDHFPQQIAAAAPQYMPARLSQVPLVGLGYWPGLFHALADQRGAVDLWEHRIDDYLEQSSFEELDALIGESPIAIHSVDLSLGSPQATSEQWLLDHMRSVLTRTRVQELSDHLGFTRVAGRRLGHFEPIWRVEESACLMAGNILRLQDALRVRIAVENIAPTFDPGGEMTTAEFLNELVLRTGCGVLLDISNLTLNERNGFCDAENELAILDLNAVVGIHLAGGAEVEGLSYDAHAFPVPDVDIMWLERLLPNLPNCRSVVIERDGRRDEVSEVIADLQRVRAALQTAARSGSHESARGQTV
jgi:uncharacterized protein (UPF0276 family)